MCGPLFCPYGVDDNEVDLFVIYVLENGDDKTLESSVVHKYYGVKKKLWEWLVVSLCGCEGI